MILTDASPPTPLLLPSGMGFRRPSAQELAERATVFDLLTVWEAPRRRGARYVVGVDVSNGVGVDRSVAQVVRVGTLEEPAEQVAEYISDSILPADLAAVLYAIGTYYVDGDGYPAKMAIECNIGPGMVPQDRLQNFLAYPHFYRWEHYDAADPSERFTRAIGWWTTPRTRPMMLMALKGFLSTRDPVTGLPDLITHSPILHNELQDFTTDGADWEAKAAQGAFDDCVISIGIAAYVAFRLHAGATEPLDERRRRRSEQQALLAKAAAPGPKPDWRNTPATSAEMDKYGHTHTDEDGDLDEQLYDPRATDSGGEW